MEPQLDWSAYQDSGQGDPYSEVPRHGGLFARAVALCIHSRQCEEVSGKGVMCPSYRVTGNPQHSTGGRIRQLKMALNQSGSDLPVFSSELDQAMALCVGCKGCKRECENAVDLAMIKIEYLAQQHARQGIPLRTRLLAASPEFLSYAFSGHLIRLRNRSSLLRKLGQTLLGISARRALPQPTPQARVNPLKKPKVEAPVAELVLFIDTFSQQFAPEQALAAEQVLNAGGYGVHPVRSITQQEKLCCGRTQLAHGLIDQAREKAKRMIEVLLPHAQAGRPIIGLEPACLLAIRDDYRYLGLGEAARIVAEKAILFEEFLAREIQAKRFRARFAPPKPGASRVLVHGHCHQKAVGAMKSMRKVLRAIPALEFEMIESSCCGMAGSFGLEGEHSSISMEMAEQQLLPALRKAPSAARIVANGFSCRHQIEEGVGKKSEHIALILRDALVTH